MLVTSGQGKSKVYIIAEVHIGVLLCTVLNTLHA